MSGSSVTIKLDDGELVRALKDLDRRTSRTFLRQASREVWNEIRDRARELAPVDTGDLRRSIRTRQRSRRDVIETRVIAGGREAPHGHLVEFGTAPHRQPRRGTTHPGAEPHPFLRPAYYQKERETREKLRNALRTRVLQGLGG